MTCVQGNVFSIDEAPTSTRRCADASKTGQGNKATRRIVAEGSTLMAPNHACLLCMPNLLGEYVGSRLPPMLQTKMTRLPGLAAAPTSSMKSGFASAHMSCMLFTAMGSMVRNG